MHSANVKDVLRGFNKSGYEQLLEQSSNEVHFKYVSEIFWQGSLRFEFEMIISIMN